MCNLCEITEGQFLQGIVDGLCILQMVNWKKVYLNPHDLTVGRFWVYCVYQFHHLGITGIIEYFPITEIIQTHNSLMKVRKKYLLFFHLHLTKFQFHGHFHRNFQGFFYGHLEFKINYIIIPKLYQWQKLDNHPTV